MRARRILSLLWSGLRLRKPDELDVSLNRKRGSVTTDEMEEIKAFCLRHEKLLKRLGVKVEWWEIATHETPREEWKGGGTEVHVENASWYSND